MAKHTLTIRTSTVEEQGTPANQRRHGRVYCERVESSLGRVLDVSASGLRVGTGLKRYKRGGVLVLEVHTEDGSFAVQARVAWSRSMGFLSNETGLEFIDLPPEAERILRATVRHSRC
jgi:hypothetical protein